MLKNLRKDLRASNEGDFVTEAMSKNVADDKIKNIFLDDKDGVVLGAENDKEIAALVAEIPEYGGDEDEEMEDDLENMIESFIPETILEAKLSPNATVHGSPDDVRYTIASFKKEIEKYEQDAHDEKSKNGESERYKTLMHQVADAKERISKFEESSYLGTARRK